MFRLVSVAMTLSSLAFFTTTRTARAFTTSSFAARRSMAGITTTARSMSSSGNPPMPYDDDKMPFYALGVNLAVQVGGQANIKTLLEDDELDIVLQAFGDTLTGRDAVDARTVLGQYGPPLNKILGERSAQILDRVKQDGAKYIDNFLDCNEDAKQTDSGLVYCPMKEGEGASPTLESTVEVHVSDWLFL